MLAIGLGLITASATMEQFYYNIFQLNYRKYHKKLISLRSLVLNKAQIMNSAANRKEINPNDTIEKAEEYYSEYTSLGWGEINAELARSNKKFYSLMIKIFYFAAWKKRKDKNIFPFRKRLSNISVISLCFYVFLFYLHLIVSGSKLGYLIFYDVILTNLPAKIMIGVVSLYSIILAIHLWFLMYYIIASNLSFKKQTKLYKKTNTALMRADSEIVIPNNFRRRELLPSPGHKARLQLPLHQHGRRSGPTRWLRAGRQG